MIKWPDKIAALILCAFCTGASAQRGAQKDDIYGPVWEIIEQDMIDSIQERLSELKKSGRLDTLIAEAKKRSIETIKRPPPVKGIDTVTKNSSRAFDPSVMATTNVFDARGNLVVKAGTKVNPLDYYTLDKWYFFFNADDPAQVRLLETVGRKYQWRIMPILVKGAPLEMSQKFRQRMYFDQGGDMSKRLQVRSVPSLVSQSGKMLVINEMVP